MIRIELNEGKLAQHDQVFVKLKALVADIKSDEKYVVSKKQSSTKFHILTSREIDFIDYLADNNHAKLQWIVDSDAKEITDKVIDEIETKFYELKKDRAKAGKKRAHFSPVYKLAEYLFVKNGYNKLTDKSQFYDATDIHVCPYCNVTEIWPIKEKGRKDTVKGELDHFYSKDSYPHLALSVYNLVPSCPFCNHGKRNMPSAKLVNPYMLKSADDARFRMDIKDGGFVDLNKCTDAIQIRLEDEKKVLGDNIKAFHLEELYNTHRDYAAEVYYKKKLKLNPTYCEFVNRQLKELHIPSLSKEDISRILWGYYPQEDFSKRVLSKFLHDLYNY